MVVYKGSKTPRSIEVCAVGSEPGSLDQTLKGLNADGWNIRQIYQEGGTYYRVFAQRESPVEET